MVSADATVKAIAIKTGYSSSVVSSATYLITAVSYIVATGGNVTTDGNYKVHTFTSNGTFQVTSGADTVDYLIVEIGRAHV
jgi:hypothetical protein